MESNNCYTSLKRIPKYYVRNEVLNIEEDQTHEFKGHRNISVYDVPPWCINTYENTRTRNAISRNLCGFLNSGLGGIVYVGVQDDGTVAGVRVTQYQQDHLLLSLQDAMNAFRPPVPSFMYNTKFLPVLESGDDYPYQLYGKELDDAFSELFPNSLQETAVEDNCSITEQTEIIDSHINTLTRLQKTVNDEKRCVSSGMQQLEQQEKAAHYTLLAEEQQCMQLLRRVSSAQGELLKSLRGFAKLAAELQSLKSAPQFISQLPLEMYKKECCQFDFSTKMMMKWCLESNECSRAEFEGDRLEELDESYTEMMLEYVCMLGSDQGKKAAIEKLKDIMNDIETSKLTVSFNDIRTQYPLLEEKVNAGKKQVSLMVQNEVLPAVEEAVKMDVLHIRKYRNEHELCKLESILNENECLARYLETTLVESELLVLLLIWDRQKLIDMRTLYQECHQEIREQYLECTSRMGIIPMSYVVEISVIPLDCNDPRVQALMPNSKIPTSPIFQCEDGQIYFRKHSTLVKYSFHDVEEHVRTEVWLYKMPQLMAAWKEWITYKTLRQLVHEATAQQKDNPCTENHSGITL